MIDIGFIGLGHMGAAIAERIESAAVRLHVHDPAAAAVEPFVARGAVSWATPREVAGNASILFACLPSPATSVAVAQEVSGGGAIETYVEMSTIGSAAIRDIATLLERHGIALVDAPVSGGPDRAREGTLAVMVGGDPAAVMRVRPFLARIAGTVFEVGDAPGAGQFMKLVNNLTAASLVAITTEAMTIGIRAGLDPVMMTAVLEASSGRSSVTGFLLPRHVLNHDFDFGATIATMMKDIDLGLGEAGALGATTPVLSAVARQWRAAGERMGWDEDLTRFMRDLEPHPPG